MKVDKAVRPGEGMSLDDVCLLAGLDRSQYMGFVALAVPVPHSGASAVIMSDAPQVMAIISALASAIGSLADSGQRALLAGDDLGSWNQ